jgi:hypothetical protein
MNKNVNWFEDGRSAAFESELEAKESNDEAEETECPWPIHTPEGATWIRGWNSVAKGNDFLCMRMENQGWSFAFMGEEA